MLIYLCGCLMLVSFKSFEFCLYRSLCTNWLVDNFVQISHLNTMENVFNIYDDYNLKILFHLVCCKWLILCGTKKLIFLIFSYFSTNHILFKWLSLLKLYTLNCENVDTKKALTMDNETSQLLWSDVHDNHHWVHVVNDGSYPSFPERKRLS